MFKFQTGEDSARFRYHVMIPNRIDQLRWKEYLEWLLEHVGERHTEWVSVPVEETQDDLLVRYELYAFRSLAQATMFKMRFEEPA